LIRYAALTAKDGSTSDDLDDVYAGSVWQDVMLPLMKEDPRHACYGCSMDGINVNSELSGVEEQCIWPLLLTDLRLPPWLRYKAEHLILALIPPIEAKKDKLHFFLTPFLSDMRDLWLRGVAVTDSLHKEEFLCRAALIFAIADLRGLPVFTGMHTSGACEPCCLCTFVGQSIGPGRVVYSEFYSPELKCVERLRSDDKFSANLFFQYLPYWSPKMFKYDWAHSGNSNNQ
jgi:hypothetical protein